MPLNDIRREHVLQAIEKCDECGRDEFLEKYGFRKATGTWLVHNGRSYDSKAIIGVAHGYARPDLGPLTSSDFSGGETVKTKLREAWVQDRTRKQRPKLSVGRSTGGSQRKASFLKRRE